MTDSHNALVALVDRLAQCEAVALDTEFVWERTYHPKLGLIQIALEDGNTALVDAAALSDLSPLGTVFSDPGIVKVFHDARQDLTILRRATGATFRNVFDNRRAAGFVGLGAERSLRDLVGSLLGIKLPKTETRSDWLKRPLTDIQLQYALDDVRHLLAVRSDILRRAYNLDREGWILEEMAAYVDAALYEDRDPEEAYLRIAGTKRLPNRQRTVLRELAAWREREATRRDIPRGHVVQDKTLVHIARRVPRTVAHVSATNGLSRKAARRYSDEIVGVVRRALSVPPEAQARRAEPRPDDVAYTAKLHLAMAFLVGRGLASGIDPALYATRADVSLLMASHETGNRPLLTGWRKGFVGLDLMKVLRGRRAVRIDPETGFPELA